MVMVEALLLLVALRSGREVVMASTCPTKPWSLCSNPVGHDQEFTFVSRSTESVLNPQGSAPFRVLNLTNGDFVVLSSLPTTYKLIYGGDSSTSVTSVAHGQNLTIQDVETG
ncbi:hypothetical protein GOP47_0009210 [Adiantum capillus-veneris]|uniref:Uncharacterized protein n=1 Tax=Adiantum capillus-veneris TaxID=13818 RepID=A0A9D4UWG8_ADICA|nr:hypothetical protein GOP47_0009210 [Adiantum capillus-veneris]